MENIVLENIRKYNMIDKKDKVVIGLSGGPDSVFLFHILRILREKLDFTLHIAHINHGVRGKEALKDQLFVENLAREYKIPFYLKKADMDGYAREHNLSSEEAGREIRYDFFDEILRKIDGDKIAVGHNKSDQVETMLMRFFRGTGIDGLRGMEYKTGKVIRPMLNIDREDLENYLKEHNYKAMIDHTNLETIYNRNKIRLETIPYIEENFNPNFIDTIFRTSDNFKEDSDFLYKYTKKTYENMLKLDKEEEIILDKGKFQKEEKAIKSRIIRYSIEKLIGNLQGITQQHIIDTIDFINESKTGKSIDLLKEIKVILSYDDIIFSKKRIVDEKEYTYQLKERSNRIEELDIKIDLDIINIGDIEGFSKDKYIKYFDYEKIKGELSIRNRRAGDIFAPLGMKGRSKKIKDFFIDEKIPRDKRDKIPLLTDEENILWIIGHRVSEDCKVDSRTKKVLRVIYQGGYRNG